MHTTFGKPMPISRESKAALAIQTRARVHLARKRAFKVRSERAKASGVLVAMSGTIQGRSGWYQDYSGNSCVSQAFFWLT